MNISKLVIWRRKKIYLEIPRKTGRASLLTSPLLLTSLSLFQICVGCK